MTFAPYDIEGDPASWDARKDEIADRSLAYYRKFFTNLDDDNIIARVVKSPLDMERDSPNSFLHGDIHGCAPYMYQTVGHRPTPDYGQYAVPGSRASISSARSCIRAAACSAPAAARRSA